MLAGIVGPLLRVRERLVIEAEALEDELVAEARADAVCRRPATVPEVGADHRAGVPERGR